MSSQGKCEEKIVEKQRAQRREKRFKKANSLLFFFQKILLTLKWYQKFYSITLLTKKSSNKTIIETRYVKYQYNNAHQFFRIFTIKDTKTFLNFLLNTFFYQSTKECQQC